MRFRAVVLLALAGLGSWGVLQAQKPFQEYRAIEYENFPLPPDWTEKTEWTRARLKYPGIFNLHGSFEGGPLNWTIDYPRSDRHLLAGIRRLTRINVRSVEQVVEADGDDDIYNWPMLYAVEVGHWDLTDDQASQIREFLLRGGFLMCDDFHGTREWQIFEASMRRVFPDREIVDLENGNPIFHTIYDLDDRYQVPGAQYIRSHRLYESDGVKETWRGIFDDKGRLIVAICHNMDLGDSWEHADNPDYDEKFSALGIRIGINYVVYAMTH